MSVPAHVDRPVVFVSYSQVDRAWAEWVSWQLEDAGYRVLVQAWHLVPSSNWPAFMQDASTTAQHVVVLMSAAAAKSPYVEAEWHAAFRADPRGERRRILTARVAECELPSLLGNFVSIDLFDLPDDQARAVLLAALAAASKGDGKPAAAPAFPGRSARDEPSFPGEDHRDGAEVFLDRVRQACADRYPGAVVRLVAPSNSARSGPDEHQYLHVDYDDNGDGHRRRWPVGVAPDGLTDTTVDRWLELVHARYVRSDPDVESELVYGGDPATEPTVRAARRRGVLLRSLPAFERQWDYRRYLTAQTARLNRHPSYVPELYVPQRYVRLDTSPASPSRPGPADDAPADDDVFQAVVDWLDAEPARLVLVLGNFGHGKTFLLRELARRLPSILPNLVPVLVELRTLEKNHSLDALLAQHLAAAGEAEIDVRAVRRMLERGQLVLLFDGFDELALQVTYERAAEHLRTVLGAVTGRAKVVLSSRTQHFLSDEQWRTALGEQVHLVAGSRLVQLAEFSETQIREFLVRLFHGDAAAADARLELIRDIQDLLGLSRNPRMLSFIADLDEQRLRTVRAEGGGVSSTDLYRELVGRWLDFEVGRRRPTRGAVPGLDAAQLLAAVTALALRMWQTRDDAVDLTLLEETTRHSLAQLSVRRFDPQQAAYAVGSGSLLVRGEEDTFGFVHSSVMEYLVAAETARLVAVAAAAAAEPSPSPSDSGAPSGSGASSDAGAAALFGSREFSPLMADFFCGCAGRELAESWVASVPDGIGLSQVARANALAVTGRLKVRGVRVRLAGQDLRRHDLSGLDLRFADLADADLRGARLRGTDFTGADLSRARLDDVVLDGVTLDRATLAGADLSGARLARCSLRGATLSGSRWVQAALLRCTTDEQEPPELADAVVAGREPARLVLAPPRADLRGVAFAPDVAARAAGNGGLVAVGWANDVALVELRRGRVVGLLSGHREPVRAVAFSPDGAVVAAAAADGTVRRWDVRSGAAVGEVLARHSGGVWSVAFSPDGSVLASCSADGTVRLWDLRSDFDEAVLSVGGGEVRSLAFSPDGTTLATGGSDRVVRLWDLATRTVRHALTGHTGWVETVAFSPDGRRLASGGFTVVRVWDVVAGKLVTTYPGHPGGVWSVAYSPDGSLLASAGADHVARLWSTDSDRHSTLAGHTARVLSVGFSPDGELLATAGADRTVAIWDVSHGWLLRRITGRPPGVGLAGALSGGGARSGGVSSGGVGKHGVGKRGVEEDGTVIEAAAEGIVRIWDVGSGRATAVWRAHPRATRAVAYAPGLVVTSGSDGAVRCWDPATGRRTGSLPSHVGGVEALALSPDGRTLASAGTSGSVRVWDVATSRRTADLPDHGRRVRAVEFSRPDGSLLASGGDDGTVRVWRAHSGRRAWAADVGAPVAAVAFVASASALLSPSGPGSNSVAAGVGDRITVLAAACDDGRVRLLDSESGQITAVFDAHPGGVTCLAFTSDGQLASGGRDGTVAVWSLHRAGVGTRVSVGSGELRSVVAVGRSRQVVAVGADGALRVLDLARLTDGPVSSLLGLPDGGWVSFGPDGGYEYVGDPTEAFWWTVGRCTFDPGELDGIDAAVFRSASRAKASES